MINEQRSERLSLKKKNCYSTLLTTSTFELTNYVALHLVHLLSRLRNNCDLVVDAKRLQQRVVTARRRGRRGALIFVVLLGHRAVSRVDVILKQLVHAEGGRADRALVREMGGFQCHVVVSGDVIEELPLENLQIN